MDVDRNHCEVYGEIGRRRSSIKRDLKCLARRRSRGGRLSESGLAGSWVSPCVTSRCVLTPFVGDYGERRQNSRAVEDDDRVSSRFVHTRSAMYPTPTYLYLTVRHLSDILYHVRPTRITANRPPDSCYGQTEKSTHTDDRRSSNVMRHIQVCRFRVLDVFPKAYSILLGRAICLQFGPL